MLFKDILKSWMKTKDMTGVDLAKLYGCSSGYISQLLQGKRKKPHKKTIEKFAEIFEISSYLFMKYPGGKLICKYCIEEYKHLEENKGDVDNMIRYRILKIICSLNESDLKTIHEVISRFSKDKKNNQEL